MIESALQMWPGLKLARELELAVLCGRDKMALKRMAARWDWEEVATDWRQVVERPDSPVFRGMVNKVPHLLKVVE